MKLCKILKLILQINKNIKINKNKFKFKKKNKTNFHKRRKNKTQNFDNYFKKFIIILSENLSIGTICRNCFNKRSLVLTLFIKYISIKKIIKLTKIEP